MKFGIHSLLFHETFLEKDLPLLDEVKRMGFDAIEIIPFDPDGFPAAKVKRAAADLGLAVNTGYGMPEQYNIISPDPAVRQRGVAFSKRLIDLSKEAGARGFRRHDLLRMGLPHRPHALGGRVEVGRRELSGNRRYARRNSGLILGIEPVNRFESHFINTAADAVRLLQEIGLPNVKVHLDTFHMIREEDDFTTAVLASRRLPGIRPRLREPARDTR